MFRIEKNREKSLLFWVVLLAFRKKNCDPSRHLQESLGPPGPKSQKSLKKGRFGGLEKSLKKYPKKPKNTEKMTGIFAVFLDFFGYFLRLFSRPPKRPFLRLFRDFGPGEPGDSCKWRLGSQKERTLKTVTSLNKEARLLKFHFSYAIIAFGDNELKCSKCYDRKASIAFRTSKYCNR